MNKTISITLAGLIFNLEEEAYHKLNQYLGDVRNHLGNSTDKNEVMSDIEASIAEKFSEKISPAKQVISSQDIDELIKVMGTVNDFDEEMPKDEKQEKVEDKTAEKGIKKLYRNPDDTIIAGVCSGLAAYFGIDPVIVRFLFALSIFFGGFGIILYIVLWIIVPEAKNTAQKLEMSGDPVTLAAIEQVIKKNVKKVKEQNNNRKVKSTVQRLIELPVVLARALVSALKGLWPVLAVLIGLFFLLAGIFSITALSVSFFALFFNIPSPYILSDIPLNDIANMPLFKVFMVSIYLIAVIPVSFLLTLGISLMRRKSAFTLPTFGILIGLWMLALIAASTIGLKYAPQIEARVRGYHAQTSISQELPLRDFTSISAGSNLDIHITKGDNYSVKIGGAKDNIDKVSAEIVQGELQLDKEPQRGICIFCVDNFKPLKVEIIMPELKSYEGREASALTMNGFTQENLSIELKQASKAEIVSDIKNMDIKQSQASSLTLSLATATSSDYLKADINSASRLKAYNFPVKKAEVEASSASHAELNVSEEFIASAQDASRILYMGTDNLKDNELESQDAARIMRVER